MIKPLTSKEEARKKQKKNQRILGLVLIIVMFGSVFGVIVGSFNSRSSEETNYTTTYGGLDFTFEGQYFQLNLGQKSFYFTESPSTYGNLDYTMNLSKNIASLYSKPLYIDAEDYYVSNEIYQNLQGYPERMQMACLENSTCSDATLPIKDCSDNLIVARTAEENKIYEKDGCIFIEGQQQDLLKLTDITILKLLGVN